MNKSTRWYSTREAGQLLGNYSAEWVRKRCVSGELRAVVYRTPSSPRSVWRISEAWLDEFRRRFADDGPVDLDDARAD